MDEGGLEDELPPPFPGDFFGTAGDYSVEDFGWPEEYDEEEDQRSEETTQSYEDEDSHEEIIVPHHDQPSNEDRVMMPPNMEGQSQPLTLAVPTVPTISTSLRTRAENAAQSAFSIQKFHDLFPDSKAGASIAHNPHLSAYNQLQANAQSQANPYHPFESSLDWQVARWAKLRGPTSTALTELLAIPGVCFFLNLVFSSLLIRSSHRLLALWDSHTRTLESSM